MSVKISRREEKRDTSLRDFLLAATLPLLVAGIIGFLIGQSGKLDAGASSEKIAAENARAIAAEERAGELEKLILVVDSLHQELEDITEQLDDELGTAIESAHGGTSVSLGGPFYNWDRDFQRERAKLADAMSEVEGNAESREILSKATLKAVTSSFKGLYETKFLALRLRKNDFSTSNFDAQQISEKISTAEEDAEKKVEDIKGELTVANRKLELKQIEIDGLKAQAANSGTTIEPISYKQEKGQINAALIKIKNSTEEIDSGVLVSKKKQAEIKAKILLEIGNIENAVDLIN